jgi:hypothetical protein
MKILSILIFATSIMATIIGALFMMNNVANGKLLLLVGTFTTWIGIVLIVYYWIILPRRKNTIN